MTLVEACIAIAIFSLLASVAYATYTTAQALDRRAVNKADALWLAEEGIEATRSVRDQSFTNLTAGTRGLSKSSGSWQFSGANDYTSGFMRTVSIGVIDADNRTVTSTVAWSERGATSTVTLATVLTNWRKANAANSATIDTTAACVYTLDPRYLGGVKLVSNGTSGAITVTQVRVAWVSTSQSMQQVFAPYPTSVWSGTAASNALTTLTTPVTLAGAGSTTFSFRWGGSVSGKTFTITFVFSDGTTKAVTITPALITVCI